MIYYGGEGGRCNGKLLVLRNTNQRKGRKKHEKKDKKPEKETGQFAGGDDDGVVDGDVGAGCKRDE